MITLRPEHQQLIEKAMQTGAYEGPDDVIGRALVRQQLEDEWLAAHRDLIDEIIERAFGQFEMGEFLTAAESRADMEKRKAEWLAARQP